MPTDVAPLITGLTYDSVINVPSTGETITEASEIDWAVALGNRIEFVRQLTSLATAGPEKFQLVREDWLGVVYDGAANFLYGDLIWKTAVGVGTPVVSLNSGSAKNPGNVVISLPAGATADQLSVGLGSLTAAMMTFASFDRFVFVFKVIDNAGNPGTQFQVGLCQTANNMATGAGGTDSLRIRYSKADSANWIVNIRKASVGTQVVTAIPFVSNEYIVAMFARNAAAGLDITINGTLVHTLAAANLPAGSGSLGFEAFKSGADVFACSLQCDLITALQTIPTRSGA